MSQEQDATFAEAIDVPTEHAKKIAKSRGRKKKVATKSFFTIKNGKVCEITFRPGAKKSVYKCRESQVSKEEIKKWSSEGKFAYQHQIDDLYQEFMKSL